MGLTEEELVAMLPPFVRAEREAVLAGTKLGDGISWLETMELDGGDKNDLAAVEREKDKDRPWQEFVDDPKWSPYLGSWGGFAFVDDRGFCYYLPAAMARCIRECSDVVIGWRITQGRPNLSFLEAEQHACLRRWAQLMIAISAFFATDEVSLWHEVSDSDFLTEKLELG
ncbi:hypothetical protein EON82_21105 [bacterium]|nr:MAG: hypothetical protein EON82_21105 [bacterium]